MPIINNHDLPKMEGDSPGLEIRAIVGEEQGSHSLNVREMTIAPMARVPRHIHTRAEEATIILEGTLDVLLGQQRITAGPGHTVLAPPGTVHGFVNQSQEPARLLLVSPSLQVDDVPSSVPGTTVGFPSTKGQTGYGSPQDRPLG